MKLRSSPIRVFGLLALSCVVLAQQDPAGAKQQLNNEAVIKLIRAGLSDALIVDAINALPGAYDTSSDGLIALKAANASDQVVSAIALRAASPGAVAPRPAARVPVEPESTANSFTASQRGQTLSVEPAQASNGPGHEPRVFLQSSSKGTNQNAARDQSMEMSKDLERDCPGVKVTINQQMADYVILLNHIEVGAFVRDNQIQIANRDGDLLTKTKEGGSIAGGMKKACALILQEWAKR